MVVVGFKFKHHGRYSGYDQIIKYLGDIKYIDRDNYDYTLEIFNIPIIGRLNLFLEKIRDFYFLKRIKAECLDPSTKKIFFLYPENTLAYLDFEIPSSVTVIATFHQPLNYFENLIFDYDKNINKIKNFKRCDKAIILEKNSVNDFSKLLKIPQVQFIPHGINLNIFQPNPKLLRKPRSILFLGNWLRDFEFAARVFQELVNKNHDIEINIIVNKRNANHFYKINNVNIYSNLSDEQLIKLLQTQTLLFLPLLSCLFWLYCFLYESA
jgi:hypothetical protein